MNVQTLHNKGNKSELDQYVLSIIESNTMLPREKIVVLLAHFEALVFQTANYERKAKDKVKKLYLIMHMAYMRWSLRIIEKFF